MEVLLAVSPDATVLGSSSTRTAHRDLLYCSANAGHDAVHILERRLEQADDDVLLDVPCDEQRTVIHRDTAPGLIQFAGKADSQNRTCAFLIVPSSL